MCLHRLTYNLQSKKSTAEELESIAEEIGGIEEFSRDTQAWHKKLIGYLLAYFSVLYLFSACVAYFRYLGHKDYQGWIQMQSDSPGVFLLGSKYKTVTEHQASCGREGKSIA